MPSHFARVSFVVAPVLALSLSLGGIACSKKSDEAPGTAPSTGSAPNGSALAAQPSATPGVLGKGVIRGAIQFSGKPPEPKTITTPDPFCSRQTLKEQDLVVASAGGIKNVLVRLTNGVKGTYPTPKTDALLDQNGCSYQPRIQAVIAGQTLQIKNSDQTLHNVHTYKGASTIFNQAQLPGMGAISKKLSDAGAILRFRCDVHPWMSAHVAVLSHPFYAVTDAEGRFTIDKVPPGTYTVEAWHERLGTKTTEIKVSDDAPADVKLAFSAP